MHSSTSPTIRTLPSCGPDFLSSIKTNKLPVCDIEIGHRFTIWPYWVCLSLKLGRSVAWDGNQIPGDAEANKLLSRAYRGEWKYPV
jgi:hypothetical protein